MHSCTPASHARQCWTEEGAPFFFIQTCIFHTLIPAIHTLTHPHIHSHVHTQVLEEGALFPPFTQIRDVSARVMAALCEQMCASGLGVRPRGCDTPDAWLRHVRARFWVAPGAATARM